MVPDFVLEGGGRHGRRVRPLRAEWAPVVTWSSEDRAPWALSRPCGISVQPVELMMPTMGA